MLPLIVFFIGGALGALRARNKGGDRLDMAQYAAIYGIVAALLTLVIGVIAGRIYGF